MKAKALIIIAAILLCGCEANMKSQFATSSSEIVEAWNEAYPNNKISMRAKGG